MTPAFRVFKNSSALTFSIFVERGISFVLPWYVARVLGTQAWGDYATAYTFVLIGATLAPWGLDNLLPRVIARDSKRAGIAFANASLISLFAGTLIIIGIILLTNQLNYSDDVKTLIYLGVLIVVLPQTEAVLSESIIQGLERMEWIVFVRVPLTILRVIGSIYLLSSGYPIDTLFIILSIYYILNCLGYFYIFKRFVSPFHIRPNRLQLRLLFFQSIPFFFIASIGEAFRLTDRIFISGLGDTDAVGIYVIGIMFTELIYMAAPAILGAIFPGLARAHVKSTKRFAYLVSWLFKVLGIISFPIMLFIIAFADQLILFFFGSEYEASIIVLRLTALGILPSFLSRLLFRTTLASDNEHIALKVAIVGNIANLLFNIIFISRYGIVGASIATVGTIMVKGSQNLWYVSRFIKFDFWQAIIKPGFCMMLSGLVFLVIIQYSYLVAFVASMFIFGIAILFTKTVTSEDLENLSLVKAHSS